MQATVTLLDLDGTLTDSAEGIYSSVRHALDTLGLRSMTDNELRGFVGPPLQDSFAQLGLPPAGIQRAIGAYREHFASTGLYENRPYEGIQEALEEIRSRSDLLAVATSKPTVFADRILDHFDLSRYFDAIVGSELDGRRTQKRDVITEALSRLGAIPDGAVMVGDREQDVLGATAVGIPCIGVAWGYAAPDELERAGAWRIVDQPTHLPDSIAAAHNLPRPPVTRRGSSDWGFPGPRR